MNHSCAALVQTCTVHYPTMWSARSVPHTEFASAGFCFHASLGLKSLPQGTAHCNQAWFMAANLPFTADQDWWRLSWLTAAPSEMSLSDMHRTLINLRPSGRRQTRKRVHKFLLAWEIFMMDKWRRRRRKKRVVCRIVVIKLGVFISNSWKLLHVLVCFSHAALLTRWPDYLH